MHDLVGDLADVAEPHELGALLFVVGPSTLLGFGIWMTMLKRHAAASVTPFALLVPIFGMASAAVALGERPSAMELIGGAIVLAEILDAWFAAEPSPDDDDRANVAHLDEI